MVAATGTNTLGLLVWTLVLTIFTWFATVLYQMHQMKSKGVRAPFITAISESLGSGLYTYAAILALAIFAWGIFIVIAVYRDHNTLIERNAILHDQLVKRDQSYIALHIKGWISNQDEDHNAIVQVWMAIDNTGASNTLRDWKIGIRVGNVLHEGRNSFGQMPLKSSLNIPFLDKEFQRPVGTVAEMQGYVTFGVPGIDGQEFANLYQDHSAAIIVSAKDSNGRTVLAEKNIYETWLEGHKTRPAH